MALLGSGCGATVEGRPNVHSSSTATELPESLDGNCMCRVGEVR